MSVVVIKVLEGSVGVEVELDYSFHIHHHQGYRAAILPSTLSGPK